MTNKYKYYDVRNLTGLNIYQVPNKAQAIYQDFFTKKYYILDNNSVLAFSNWRLRLPLSILIVGILAMFKINIVYCIIIGIIVYILSTFFFYKKIIPQLKETVNFKKPTYKTIFHSIAARYTRIKLLEAFATALALAIIIFIAVFSGKFNDQIKNIAIAMIVAAIVFAIFIFYLIHLKFTDTQLIAEEEDRYKYMKARK